VGPCANAIGAHGEVGNDDDARRGLVGIESEESMGCGRLSTMAQGKRYEILRSLRIAGDGKTRVGER
jgi:hypothetical protein